MLSPEWLRLFQTAWFVGFLGGGLVYFLLCLVNPPPGKPYQRVPFGNEGDSIIEGYPPSDTDTPTDVEKASVMPSLKAVAQ